MTDNTIPTTDQCKEFTMLLGVEWHEIKSEGYYDGIRQVEQPKCSCGKPFLFLSELKDHIARNNPTYSDAASILLPMREKFGEHDFNRFIVWLEHGHDLDIKDGECFGYIHQKYIFSPRALIEKALEWMRKEKGE